MSDFLTTAEASKRAKVSRPTISRALKAGEISGHRGNDSRWLIDSDSLDAWIGARSIVNAEQRVNVVHEQGKDSNSERLNAEVDAMRAEISDLREKLARKDGEASANKERITDLTAERDRLLSMLEARPVSFWGRLFGRS